MESPALLEMRGITKTFPGVVALSGVDFTLRQGEIHALMGENGAGKSTLIKVLTGVYRPDAGRSTLAGAPIAPRDPHDAQRLGISTVYQEVNLIPGLSVAENIYLGRQPRRFGSIDWRATNRLAEAAVSRLDLELDVTRPLSSYSIAIQQLVAIARALDFSARVLVLDEPTSSLDAAEVATLFGVMNKLKEQGLGILFVTHFLDQVYQVSNRITVLRNGHLVGEYETAELPRIELIARMMGREVEEVNALAAGRAETNREARTPILRARGLGRKGGLQPVDLDIAAGETVGLAGLLGSGRTETARLLFAADQADTGRIEVDGVPRRLRNCRQAIALGLGFCPEDRKADGIIPDLSVRENLILVLQARRGWLRRLTRRQQAEIADRYTKALSIATPDAEQPVKLLSGGNQQKVILARWLASQPRILMLDEPTRGIDVGTKFEIARLIESLRREGMAILFISSELEEVVRSSQRVVVLRDRRKAGELEGDAVTEGAIMAVIAGKQEADGAGAH